MRYTGEVAIRVRPDVGPGGGLPALPALPGPLGRLGRLGRLEWAVRADSAAVGISPALTRWLLWAPPVLGVLIASTVVIERGFFVWVLKEDHPIEWAQFACVLGAGVVAAMASLRLSRRGRAGVAAVFVLFALGSFMLAGEEISWGQRVMAIATPAELRGVNRQGEMNVHNITGSLPVEGVFELIQLLIALAGSVLPIVTRLRRPGDEAWLRPGRDGGPFTGVWRALSPPLVVVPGMAVMFLYRFVRMFLLPRQYDAVVGFQEFVELWFYLGLLVFALAIYAKAGPLRIPRHRGGPAGAPTRPVIVTQSVIVIAAVITVVFAVLSMLSGIPPG
jgi:hypothetical protein